jgi:hypothetical protein
MYQNDGKLEKCHKCSKKGGWLRVALMLTVFCVFFLGSYKGYTDMDRRVENNANWTVANTKVIERVNARTANTFKLFEKWAGTVQTRLFVLEKTHGDTIKLLDMSVKAISDEVERIHGEQLKLRKALRSGKLTEGAVVEALAILSNRATQIEQRLEVLAHNPQELMEKVVKPTVGIAVRDKNNDRLRGSGVLFKREKYVDAKTGRTMYRYYGFTAYHVWKGIFEYLEKVKKAPTQSTWIVLKDGRKIKRPKIDTTLNPQLIIRYYGGRTDQAVLYIIGAKFIHPTANIDFVPVTDVAVFTFTSHRDNLAIAELATDAEIKEHVYYGSRIYATGVAANGVPSLYFGTTANPKMKPRYGIMFNVFGWFGQSGGPIYDAKTLKVISMTQRGSMPISNLAYGTLLSEFRKAWHLTAPKAYKCILDGKGEHLEKMPKRPPVVPDITRMPKQPSK